MLLASSPILASGYPFNGKNNRKTIVARSSKKLNFIKYDTGSVTKTIIN